MSLHLCVNYHRDSTSRYGKDLFVRTHPVLSENKCSIPYIFIESTEDGDET